MTDDDQSELKQVCFVCVGEEYLSSEVKKDGSRAKCSYCGKTRRCFDIETLADHIESAFERHYTRTSPDPDDFEYMMMRDRESNYDFERHGEPAIWAIVNAAEIDEAIAADVQEILEERHSDFEMAKAGEECEFADDSYYEEKGADDIELREEWRLFENSLRTESRYFNKHAEGILGSLFEGLSKHQTFDGKSVVVSVGPGQEIVSVFRARVFQSTSPLEDALKRPDLGLGPPPASVAVGGRMNARGISVFYGALEPEVALAEIRPPVGSRVMVGKFDLARALKLLDVEALRSLFIKGSIFDSAHIFQLERAKFLGRLSDRITRPVMPNDEPLDYLVTQAIADYLASQAKLDGILYPSAQAAGEKKNFVLFHHASRVKELELPPETELEARTSMNTEDGPEADYWVSEEVPEPRVKPAEVDDEIWPFDPSAFIARDDRSFDPRKITLHLDMESLNVHHIEAVSFVTTPHPVRRHRWTKGNLKL